MAQQDRPLSPHLQVYRWQITMVMSILHRFSGVGLGLGTLLMAYWLIAAAAGPDDFNTAQNFVGSFVGRIILLGFTFALTFHFCNGMRHLLWDSGRGFELSSVRITAWIVVIASVVLTLATWIIGYAVRGAL